MKIGDPMLEDTHVGATISGDHAQKVMGYVNTAIKEVKYMMNIMPLAHCRLYDAE